MSTEIALKVLIPGRAAQIVAEVYAIHRSRLAAMPAKATPRHPPREWSEQRAIAFDLYWAGLKASGALERMRDRISGRPL